VQGFDMTEEIPLATMIDPPYGPSGQWTEAQLRRYNQFTAKTNYTTGKQFLCLSL
jgi:hypothetical protein